MTTVRLTKTMAVIARVLLSVSLLAVGAAPANAAPAPLPSTAVTRLSQPLGSQPDWAGLEEASSPPAARTATGPVPATGGPALPSGQGDPLGKVETAVLAEMSASSQADFFVWMAEKADLWPAYQLKTKEEKGHFVFETLRATAERTQKMLREELNTKGIAYQPFYIANKILIHGGDQTLLLNVASRPDVARITANHQFQLEAPIINPSPPINILAVESNISFVNADDVWALGYNGAGIVLAGNDTGLDWDHPALINRYRGWNGVTANHNYNWWDATDTYPSVPDDGYGHGTHTTGTMVGYDGGANQIGMAPGAQTIHCKNMTDWGGGSDATFTECFEWDLAPWNLNGANPRPDLAPDAVNNSWGYSGGDYPVFEDEIAALQAAGILVEVSAGNSGPGCASLGSPGDYRQALTTGSVNHAGGNLPGTLTEFSSRGPSDLYPTEYIPDVMAPGENIRSSVPGGGYQGGWSGTSMSGPHVTGLVGLIWSANPALRGMVTSTMQIILNTAVPLTGQTGSNCGGNYTEGPNNDWGYGTLDALAAVRQAMAYGGAGTLAGTVTSGLAAVPDAAIQATLSPTLTWRATSDALGNYSMRVLTGTYTVTTSAYSYYPATVAGVSVVSGTTTTLNIALTPAETYVVSGTVSDASTGWPLYASLEIEGYPGDAVWTDPVSGFYSITLAAGVNYTFRVAAASHASDSRAVGPLTGDETQSFTLRPSLGGSCLPGYEELLLFHDGFESWTLGPGWSTFTTNNGRVQVSSAFPYAGSRSVLLDDSTDSGPLSMAAIILTHDLSGQSQVNLDFWWREFDDEDNPEDGVFISDDRGVHWYRAFSFNGGPSVFRNDAIDISAAAAANGLTLNDHFQIKFQFYDDYPIPIDGYAIDEVRLRACAPFVSGRVVGHVHDANTDLPLGSALVASDSGHTATADANGLYILFDSPGSHTYTATLRGGYGPDTRTVTVVQGSTVQQDFHLPAGRLSYAPPALEATLDLGMSTTVPFTLSNDGGVAASFELGERQRGSSPPVLSSSGPLTASEPLVPPESRGAITTRGMSLPPAPTGAILSAGDVIQSWSPGLAYPWGIGFNTMDNDLWLGNIAAAGGDDLDYRFLTDGTNTGDTIDTRPWVGTFAADMTYNPLTGKLWQMNVSGDDCIHELDPVNRVSTGNTLCPGWSISQRGLAYDPSTNTYFAGGWNDATVYHFAADGSMLGAAYVGLSISGLAYNPDTRHLFVMVNSSPNPVYVLDVASNYALIGQFSVSAGFGPGAGAGLEMDCQGNLWAVDQNTRIVYQFESGETTTMCMRDVPWLSEAPVTGTIAANPGAQVVNVTFDAGIPEIKQPGQYYAELRIKEDTPYDLPGVPVTMTVQQPATWGKLTGTVRSLGHCDATPALLDNAQVFVQGSSGMTWTLTTNISGTYGIWLDQAHSPLTVTVTYPNHEMGQATGVVVTGQVTTSLDFDLRWLRPCLSVSPTGVSAALAMGQTATQALTITNRGAAATSFRIQELEGGYVSALLSAVRVPGYQPSQGDAPAYAAGRLAAREGWSYQPRMGTLLDSTPADVVLVAAADVTQIRAMLQAYPDINRVDTFDARLATPTLAQLVAYDVAIVISNQAFANPVALGDVLADYVDAGGTVIQSVPSFYDPSATGWGLRGRFVTAGYSPFIGTGDRFTWAALGDFDSSHPIMRGVTGAGDSLRQMVTLNANADLVAEWGDDEFVAAKGSVVALNTFLADGYVWTGDVDLIVHNSIVWLQSGGVAWLSEVPATGVVGADGSTRSVDVIFDTRALTQPGEYHATLNVGSDDPLNNPIGAPVTMTVDAQDWGKLNGTITSQGYCDAASAPLAGAQVLIRGSSGMSWTLSTGVNGAYALWLDSSHSPLTVTVTHPNYETGQASGLSVTSRMTTTQSFDLRWQQPCVSVNPTGLSVTLDPGRVMTQALTIANNGALLSDFVLREVSRGSETPTAPLQPAGSLHSAGRVNVVREDRKEATLAGSGQSLAGGGPDPFGYVYRDSHEPDGPAYAWVEIAPPAGGNGTSLGMAGIDDGYFWPLLLPFNFRYYGADYGRLAIGSNGVLYFQDAYLGFYNAPIPGPSGYGVDTFIAPFWDDLVVYPGDVYYRAQDETLIIEYYQVRQYGTSGDYGSWEAILFENGNILFQYQDVTIGGYGDYGASATVGIQGNTTTGLQYSYNTGALSDNLAICYAYPGLSPDCSLDVPWLSENPTTGTVTADGGTQPIQVTFDTTGLTQPGAYYATLLVDSADPLQPITSIPVTLTVQAWGLPIYLPLIQKDSR